MIDTSFTNFLTDTTVPKEYEYPSIEEEFTKTNNGKLDEILYCFHAKVNHDHKTLQQAIESQAEKK